MFAAILKALLYLKARQAGGESIKEVLEEFEDERKRAKWQMKMRDRLSLHTRTSKS
jgi:HEPN domain-containing protein